MVILKSKDEIEKIRKACRIVAMVLSELEGQVKPGKTTLELDQLAEKMILKFGAKPAFKGYRGFPATLCASINDEVVHGIPSQQRVLKEGDIIGLDLGAIVDGYYGDAAITVSVGSVPDETQRLIKVTKESLSLGIQQVEAGKRISDISHAIQAHVEKAGFSVVTDFVGHGIGRNLHEDPQIPNFGKPGQGLRLKSGMTLAIEPMVNMGSGAVQILEDNWTAVTQDGKLSAHFEHTVLVGEGAAEILTERPSS
jgi:methionyl aminopeptidase